MSGRIESAEAWFVDLRRAIKELGPAGSGAPGGCGFFCCRNGASAAIWREDKYGTD